MKTSVKVAFCGIITALVCAVMAASHIPNITLTVPAVAGVFMIAAVAQLGVSAALSCFAVSSALSFFIGNKTSWFLFLVLFGYYPILKPVLEKIKNPIIKWALKVCVFNTAAVICYFTQILAIGVKFTGWWILLAFAIGNAAFVLYDIAVSRIAAFYYSRLYGRITSMLKNRR